MNSVWSRFFLVFVACLTCGCSFVVSARVDDAPQWKIKKSNSVRVTIDTNNIIRESFPDTLFGFNINYRSFQNQLWDKRSQSPKFDLEEYLKPFSHGLYRYPGGNVANSFDWSNAVASLDKRKSQMAAYSKTAEKPFFGINEYLKLVDDVGGTSFYVLNLLGLDAMNPLKESSSELMTKQNSKLVQYMLEEAPKNIVPRYYQLGNELDRHKYEWSPKKYIDRSLASINAIHKVDPNAKFVAFLRGFKWRYHDKSRGVSKPGEFIAEVLNGLPMVEDYSLHHYYDGKRKDGKSQDIPFWLQRIDNSIQIYRQVRSGKSPSIWITEHSRQKSSNRPNNDFTRNYTSNLGGAISAADYLIALMQFPEVKGAFWHALNAGPWQLFDVTVKHKDHRPRPIYWGLRVLRKMDLPKVLATRISSTNKSGYQGGYDVRAVAFSSSDGGTLGLWIVNRASQGIDIQLESSGFKGQDTTIKHFFLAGKEGGDPDQLGFEPRVELDAKPIKLKSAKGVLNLNLPPASVSTFIIENVAPAVSFAPLSNRGG